MERRILWLVAVCCVASCPLAAQDTVGTAGRAEVTLNGLWSYVLNQSDAQIPTSGWNIRRVPEIPMQSGTASVWYQHTLNIPSSWMVPGRSFFLKLEKAGHYSAIYWNGNLVANHFGQFSPFEADVTSFVVSGQNTIDIYVHKADTIYVRPGVNIDQSSCPHSNPDCIGNAYRAYAPNVTARNWVGIVGDITFSWRPAEHISDVFVQPSVRNWTLQAQIQATGASDTAMMQATVLDGGNPVLTLPPQSVTSGAATLSAPWTNPVLWGPSPYGQPKLYTLRTDLLENGAIVDSQYTRFGFRESWVSGKDILLNGKKLWFVGMYRSPLETIRYINDRRAQGQYLFIMESSGFNLLQWHWDDLGDPFLDVADEMGILVLGSFHCDGRPEIQSQVDDVTAWTDWMSSTAQEWMMARRKHASIVLWKPTDAAPPNVPTSSMQQIAAAAQALDSTRPFADLYPSNAAVDSWAQTVISKGSGTCDDGSYMTSLVAKDAKPLIEKELGLYSLSVPCVSQFFDTFYQKGFLAGISGMMANGLPLFNAQTFSPPWFSLSGPGNRPTSVKTIANWTRPWIATPSSMQFKGLYQAYVQPTLLQTSPTAGEYQASGLPAGAQTAFLAPAGGAAGDPAGVLVAEDGSGTAWFTVPQPGNYQLIYNAGNGDAITNVSVAGSSPYGFISLSPNPVTFPMQLVGSSTPASQVVLYNNQPSDLTISAIGVTGPNQSDFSQTNNCPATLPQSAQCTISVTFNPGAVGSRTAVLKVSDSAPGSPHAASLSGLGTLVFLAPNPLALGVQPEGTASPAQNLTLQNQSTAAVQIASISFAGNNPQDFSQTNTCPVAPATLGIGASCTIAVVFRPHLTGERSAVLNVVDTANPNTQTATLTGYGTYVSYSATSLDFGSQTQGTTSAPKIVTLTNIAKAPPLFITSMGVGGADPSDFAEVNNCPIPPNNLAQNKKCGISVTFTPTTTGPRTATIVINDTGGGSPQFINLTGTGTN